MKRSVQRIVLILLCAGMTPAQEIERLGDGNDGNRYTPVHRIELFDETGVKIHQSDKNPQPFSTRTTCGECHDYAAIARGWHFRGPDEPAETNGRPGEPWVLADRRTRTQIAVSSRGWPGTFSPESLGLSAWEFVNLFGGFMPGGGYGEAPPDPERPHEMLRKPISGDFEINCLICHGSDYRQDASLAALQAARWNYRWIPAAFSGLAVVNGVASELTDFFDPLFDEGIKTAYNPGVFDKDDMVVMDLTGRPNADRCYFCHSARPTDLGASNEWQRDEDVHMTSGLTCVDCHRNGVAHRITRGIETDDPARASLTCEGCHLGAPETIGRLGAPRPRHVGIPLIHFESLTCTACHSGDEPREQTGRWQTARIHRLGLHGKHKVDLRLPHIYGPVMMKGEDGRIGPHYLFWPAFWARMDNGQIAPMPPAEVQKAAGTLLQSLPPETDDWPELTGEEIAAVLKQLSAEEKPAVYIAGGKLYRMAGDSLEAVDDPAAAPVAWPIAHDVRPAVRSLGARSCADCHATDSPFFFAKVQADGPVAGDPRFVEAVSLQGIDRLYMKLFNFSFVFRPWLKTVALGASGLIALVLLSFAVRAVGAFSRAAGEDE